MWTDASRSEQVRACYAMAKTARSKVPADTTFSKSYTEYGNVPGSILRRIRAKVLSWHD